MLMRGIVPCRPAVDVGYDIVASAGGQFHRLQVKSTQSNESFERSGSYRFNVCRRKSGAYRDGYYKAVKAVLYEESEVDFFVFVHIPTSSCFVVPSTVVVEYSAHISLRPGCEYENAWHLLKRNEQT